METRQTTNLKIAGSTPARLVFLIKVNRYLSKKEGDTTAWRYHRRIGYGVRSGIDGMDVCMDVWYVLIVCEYGYKKNKKVDYLTFPSVWT